jgi:hypothetical protein
MSFIEEIIENCSDLMGVWFVAKKKKHTYCSEPMHPNSQKEVWPWSAPMVGRLPLGDCVSLRKQSFLRDVHLFHLEIITITKIAHVH